LISYTESYRYFLKSKDAFLIPVLWFCSLEVSNLNCYCEFFDFCCNSNRYSIRTINCTRPVRLKARDVVTVGAVNVGEGVLAPLNLTAVPEPMNNTIVAPEFVAKLPAPFSVVSIFSDLRGVTAHNDTIKKFYLVGHKTLHYLAQSNYFCVQASTLGSFFKCRSLLC
jgi:hypothetical protein